MPARNHNPSVYAPRYPELGRNTSDRPTAELNVSGTLPPDLSGVLYRNGPGMFRRSGRTKLNVLDGDGVIQRLELNAGRARYGRRFVRTPKFEAEAAAGRFLSPTWTTPAPGIRANVNPRILPQAGITIQHIHGKLVALDEAPPGFEINPATLETRGEVAFGLPDGDNMLKAHARHFAGSGDWIFASTRMGRHGLSLDFLRQRADGTRVATPTVRAPRLSYLHDFGATERYAIVILQPAFLRALRFLAGFATIAQALAWRPQEGNVILVVDLATGTATRFEAPAAWFWHIANVFERGDEIVVDFVGYDDPGHFLGHAAQLAAIMRGEDGRRGAPGHLRRYVLQPRSGQLRQTILSSGNFEFPSTDPRSTGAAHRNIYVTHGREPGMLHSGIAAFDTRTGVLDSFDFGADVNALEPVFAAKPGGDPDAGWLITQTLDTRRETSGFAILDAQRVGAGPIATVELGETMPISFHGCWVGH